MASKPAANKRKTSGKRTAKKKPKSKSTRALASGITAMVGTAAAAALIQPGDTSIPLTVDYEGPLASDANVTGQGGDAILNRINNILVGGNGVFIFRNNGNIFIRRVQAV